jgi:hypothetical protein
MHAFFCYALILGLGVIVSSVVGDDRSALACFFASTQGTQWTKKDGWGTSSDICSWLGVTCDPDALPNALHLQLPFNNLRGDLPSAMACLENPTQGLSRELIYLDLSQNYLFGNFPLLRARVYERLTLIYFYSNRITGPLTTLSGLPDLYDFEVYSNMLTGGITYPIFYNNSKLFYLEVHDNLFDDLEG